MGANQMPGNSVVDAQTAKKVTKIFVEDLVPPFVFVTRREIPLESDKDQISRGGRHDTFLVIFGLLEYSRGLQRRTHFHL